MSTRGKFGWWLNDRRWAANMRRVRRIQRDLLFGQRVRFFEELRPKVPAGRIAYPDALMYVTVDDVCRALIAAHDASEERRRK
jgi:hypothetical protein